MSGSDSIAADATAAPLASTIPQAQSISPSSASPLDETALRIPGSSSGDQSAGHWHEPQAGVTVLLDQQRKTRKLRQPRISEACIRCKARKTRCVRNGPGVCVYCESAGSECIIAPRARRKNAKRGPEVADGPHAAPNLHAAPSPASMQHLLHGANPMPYPFYQSYLPYHVSPPVATSSLAPLAIATSPFLPAAQTTSLPPAPPSAVVHPPYDPKSSRAPISDIRSAQTAERDLQPVVDSVSPSSSTPCRNNGNGPLSEYEGEGDDHDSSEGDEGDAEEEEGWHDQAARGVAFLSLSANGNPTYVGPSSGFSWARMVLGGMAGAAPTRLDTSQPFQSTTSSPQVQLADDALAGVSDELADNLLGHCFRHIQPRYGFLDWLWIHEIWNHRLAITRSASQPTASKLMRTAAFFIWILFAIGCRLQKNTVPTLATPEAYYAKAMQYLETIVGLHDLKNVQALLLMIMYSFRSNEAPGVWYLVGIVLRLSSSLGLHRSVPPRQARQMSPYVLQLRRRIFWSAYTLDRMMAMSLGRPCGIADHDCDIELPMDYDCIATKFDVDNPPSGPTSMTSSILYTKLMRIESIIQKQAYRVDGPSCERPDAVLRLIDEWESQIPAIASQPTCWNVPCCSREWFLARSGDARLYLLRPLTANPATAEPSLIRLVAKYAADACEIQKRFHQSSAPLALEALRSIFLTGLTLLHAVQLDRHAIPLSTLSRAVRACSNTMFLFAQAFPGAGAYSDVFEELANAVLDKLSMSPETAAVAPPPASLVAATATPLFTNLWDDLPTMMASDTQDSFLALLESLGVSTDSLGPDASVNSLFAAGADGLDLSELSAFAPTSGLAVEPFALGSSTSGVW